MLKTFDPSVLGIGSFNVRGVSATIKPCHVSDNLKRLQLLKLQVYLTKNNTWDVTVIVSYVAFQCTRVHDI